MGGAAKGQGQKAAEENRRKHVNAGQPCGPGQAEAPGKVVPQQIISDNQNGCLSHVPKIHQPRARLHSIATPTAFQRAGRTGLLSRVAELIQQISEELREEAYSRTQRPKENELTCWQKIFYQFLSCYYFLKFMIRCSLCNLTGTKGFWPSSMSLGPLSSHLAFGIGIGLDFYSSTPPFLPRAKLDLDSFIPLFFTLSLE